MPSGKNRIPKMAELRDAIEAEEFAEVTTYIQSGNIVLRSPLSREETSVRIAEIIRAYCGAELQVITTDASELKKHLRGSPFGDEYQQDRVFYTTTMEPIDPKRSPLSRGLRGRGAPYGGGQTLYVPTEGRKPIEAKQQLPREET